MHYLFKTHTHMFIESDYNEIWAKKEEKYIKMRESVLLNHKKYKQHSFPSTEGCGEVDTSECESACEYLCERQRGSV